MSQQQQKNDMQKNFYRASAADFGKIPGNPIAYWISEKSIAAFSNSPLSEKAVFRAGLQTGDNDTFLRYWYEVCSSKFVPNCKSREESAHSKGKWFPHNKGGGFRKWHGNKEYVINWENDGSDIKEKKKADLLSGKITANNSKCWNQDYYFQNGLTWSSLSSADFSLRSNGCGFLFDTKGQMLFPNDALDVNHLLGFLNSKVSRYFLTAMSPTLDFNGGVVSRLPLIEIERKLMFIDTLVLEARNDWDSNELSWDFSKHYLLGIDNKTSTLKIIYQKLVNKWILTIQEVQRLEEKNNRLFIDAYGLQDELTPEVPLSEITLTCNPHYRYGGNLTDEEREARLQSDTICELISYVIGCMMGRYSLDREGLVYAHAGNEGFKTLVEEGAYATFAADEDGILPLSTDSWFADDVATRLEAFVCTVWGKETLEENLQFIADSLCLAAIKPVKKGGETSRETLRRYLSTQFYKDHLKTYKKRPIYWLFSSGKEKAFECLVYLHRYNEATLPRMRTEYVTPLLGQMAGRIERLRLQQTEASTSDAKRIGKEIDSLTKQLSELRAFDDQLKHHADMRITLDLDDGVKVNYGKFGTLLSDVKAITGDKGE
ncbi:BREX-1 system adenine-specific DNA-methyltransferase PglX [Aeromonas jandaei]|uniref:BREX-1 system adenine-specific DNA-methyltransferase PglX n=1 Tax=Aeromonas jandaei TaxID=650 RepID=UPI003BA231CA